VRLAFFVAFLSLFFWSLYRLGKRVRPEWVGTPKMFRWIGNVGPYPKVNPKPSPEAEAYSKHLLEERRGHKID
jgi:hypothetical protein